VPGGPSHPPLLLLLSGYHSSRFLIVIIVIISITFIVMPTFRSAHKHATSVCYLLDSIHDPAL
jgi:hypothetical protein